MLVLYFCGHEICGYGVAGTIIQAGEGRPGAQRGLLRLEDGKCTRSQVNRCLYSNACFFNFSETDRPAWKVIGPLKTTEPAWVRPRGRVVPLPIAAVEPAEAVELLDTISANAARHLSGWQKLAYQSWVHHKRRGVVEAVTGAGKTRLGDCGDHRSFRNEAPERSGRTFNRSPATVASSIVAIA